MARALALLVLALVAAGCVGSDAASVGSAVDRLTGPTEEELRATPGSIEGLVLTPSLAPIPGARVTLLRENVSTTTDGGGFFRFASLANGAYLVAAEAEGYEARAAQATATNGTVFELNLTLAPSPRLDPFVEERELAGLLACGVETDTPEGRRSLACSGADPNHRDRFEVDLLPDAQGLVVELVWDAEGNPGASRLVLELETVGYGALDESLGAAQGEGGYARLEVDPALLAKYYPEGGRYRAIVRLAPGDPPSVAYAFGTPFTLYASAFHHAPAPAGHAVAGGA